MPDCHLCEGRETMESLLTLQLAAAPVQIPLCRKHIDLCEGALHEIRRIQSPPVVVNVSGVTAGSAGGRLG